MSEAPGFPPAKMPYPVLVGGSFPVTLTLNEVEARPCQPSPGAFRAQLITVAGSGTISF